MSLLIEFVDALRKRFGVVLDEREPPLERELLHIYSDLHPATAAPMNLTRLTQMLCQPSQPWDASDPVQVALLAEALQLIAGECDWRLCGIYVACAVGQTRHELREGWIRCKSIW